MPCYEGKPNPGGKEATKRKPTPMRTAIPTPVYTISGSSSDISNSDDSLLGAERHTNFRYPVVIEDVSTSSDSEDGIVLYLHDISYMREAVKQAEQEEETSSTVESFDELLVGDNIFNAGTSSNSSFPAAPTVSLINLLENDSNDGSSSSFNLREASATHSATNNSDASDPSPSSR